jgi:hypothetical protein
MTELAVGSIGPKFQVGPLTRTHFVRYAGASADFNPFRFAHRLHGKSSVDHQNHVFKRRIGFAGVA